MDNSNWMPAQAESPTMDAGDWRSQLQPDSRQRIVTKIMETLKKHLPFSGQEGLHELQKIVLRFEEKIYTAATSQSDYLRKISLKSLTMETKSQNSIANSLPSSSPCNSEDPLDPASHSMQSQVHNQGQSIAIPLAAIQNQVPSNMFANPQRQIQGRQQVLPQQQHQQSQNQLIYQQQLQQQLYKQKLQQGMQSHIQQQQQQQQQQNKLQPTQLQSSQSDMQTSSAMQPPVMQSAPLPGLQQSQQSSVHQSTQSMLQQHPQSVLRQQQQPQQAPVMHQQQKPMTKSVLSLQQQQQHLMGQQPNATNMQQNLLIGQQNSISDMQQLQRRRLFGQLNNLPNQQQQPPLIGNQFGNFGMQTNQQSLYMLQQSKVSVQQQNQQSTPTLFPTQGKQSQPQPTQQQLMSQIQTQPAQLQQQLGFPEQQNSLQQDVQQRLQTSGVLLLQQNIIDQQKQLFQSQRAFPEASSTSLDSTAQTGHVNGVDWQEEVYQKIKTMKEMYLPELNAMYQTVAAKLQQHDSLPQQPKTDQLDKLKIFKTMLERIMAFLQVPKNNVLANYKEKLGSYEKQIISFLNTNRPRKAVSSLQQGQLFPPNMHSMQHSQLAQSQINHVQPHENQMNPQLQPRNLQGSVATIQQNNMLSLQHGSLSSLSGVSNAQQNMMNSLQPGSNLDSGKSNVLSSLPQVVIGSLQQNPGSAPQQANINSSAQSGLNVLQPNINTLQSNSNIHFHMKQQQEQQTLLSQQLQQQFQQQLMQKQLLQLYHQQQQQQQLLQQTKKHENQKNHQVQSMNVQGAEATVQQNNMMNLQHGSMCSVSGVPTVQQYMMNLIRPSSKLDLEQSNILSSLPQVVVGSLQQNPVSAPQQANINTLSTQSEANLVKQKPISSLQQEQFPQHHMNHFNRTLVGSFFLMFVLLIFLLYAPCDLYSFIESLDF